MRWPARQEGKEAPDHEVPPGFVEAVEAIYDAAPAPERWPVALQAIADAFGDVGAHLIYQREDGAYGTICSPGLEAAQRDYDAGEWWRHDVRFSRSLECGAIARSDTISDRDIATPEEMKVLPFYARFLRSHGLGWFGGVAFDAYGWSGVAITILILAVVAATGAAVMLRSN